MTVPEQVKEDVFTTQNTFKGRFTEQMIVMISILKTGFFLLWALIMSSSVSLYKQLLF